jgi:uncharacterized protein YbbK (DUF523 family)
MVRRCRALSQLRIGPLTDPARVERVPGVRTPLGSDAERVDTVKVPAEGPVLISACLAGVPCTHAAEAKTRAWALKLVADGRGVTVCPEVAGGLPIPRPEAEITGGGGEDVLEGRARVRTVDEHDVTENYVRGAQAAVAAAIRSGATLAVLKARSPSCGCGAIYDGTFTGRLVDGEGVTAAALRRADVDVVSDEEIDG